MRDPHSQKQPSSSSSPVAAPLQQHSRRLAQEKLQEHLVSTTTPTPETTQQVNFAVAKRISAHLSSSSNRRANPPSLTRTTPRAANSPVVSAPSPNATQILFFIDFPGNQQRQTAGHIKYQAMELTNLLNSGSEVSTSPRMGMLEIARALPSLSSGMESEREQSPGMDMGAIARALPLLGSGAGPSSEETPPLFDGPSASAGFADGIDEQPSLPVVERQTVVIEPPPPSTYPSEEAAIAALHAWTKDHGFNVTKRRAFYTDAVAKEVWKRGFSCDRGGKPKCTQHLTDAERQRPMRGSMRMGCPMKIIVRAVSEDDPRGAWLIVHTRNGSQLHNHPPSEDARVHPDHRRRAAAATEMAPAASLQELVHAQTSVGTSAAAVCASLLQADPGTYVIPQDIANMRNAARRRELSAQTVMEALFARLEEDGFYYRWEAEPETQHLLYLFWAHPRTLELFRRHPEILGMDCTYKTNKYKLPLLNVIVLTGFNTVLPVAQCWLPREREEDYLWAMNTLRSFLIEMDVGIPGLILTDRELAAMNANDTVFPSVPAVICRWHMNKNVLSKTRQVLGQVPVVNPAPGQPKYENTWQTDAFMEAFYATVDAASEEEFEEKKVNLQKLNRELSDYLDNHWWKYKTKIVRAWTDRYRHFGVRDTSFVEGAHAKCKIWLRGSRGDLYTVYMSLLPWWQAAAAATSLLAQRNAVRIPYLLQGNRFAAVARVITVWALRQTYDLWEEARAIVFRRSDRDECTGVFRTVHGRPCIHELIVLTESNGRRLLSPHDFALHWWINRGQEVALPVRVHEPMYTEQAISLHQRRVERRRRNAPYSTRRDPVLYERVDLNHPASPPPARHGALPADDTTLTTLPPLTNSTDDGSSTVSTYHEHNVPARFWGYASWS